jgi:prepilin-type processing-associated H-X9-DG protein
MTDLRPYINAMCEPGNSQVNGAYVDGHVDAHEFASAVGIAFLRPITPADVTHGYYRVIRGTMHFTSSRGRGARAVTWVDW